MNNVAHKLWGNIPKDHRPAMYAVLVGGPTNDPVRVSSPRKRQVVPPSQLYLPGL